MVAPKIAKRQAKEAKRPRSEVAAALPTRLRPGHDLRAQLLFLQQTIGNQATQRLLTQWVATGSEPAREAEPTPAAAPEADLEGQASSERGSESAGAAAARPRPNRTGLPGQLKAGVEALSGFAMDEVRVHYNSPQPQALGALAYARGRDIHVGPGQQRHLAHEAWHVVQQMQGRVAPTTQVNGASINDDRALEREADTFAKTVSQKGDAKANRPPRLPRSAGYADPPVARAFSPYRIDRFPLQLSRGRLVDIRRRPNKKERKKYEGGAESVRILSEDEKKEARAIMRRLLSEHNVKVKSSRGIKAIQERYRNAPLTVRVKVGRRPWILDELRAIEVMLNTFKQATGSRRTAATPQEVSSVSAINASITEDAPTGTLSTDLGESFASHRNISLFTRGLTYHSAFPTPEAEIEGTARHEGTHAFAEPRFLAYFIANTGYWMDWTTPRPSSAESPPTDYARQNPREDLAESMSLFQTGKLSQSKHPLRFAACQHIMDNL